MATLRILVADDHDLVRKGVRALVEEHGWEVAAEARDGREAVEKAQQIKPDIAILDISMPSLNGLDAAKQIVQLVPRTKVLVLTMHDADPLIRQVLATGARGYLLKSDVARDLVSAVDALHRNETFFTHKVAQVLLDGYLGKLPVNEGNANKEGESLRLTDRQREIVQLLAEGKSSKEVAVVLGVSVKTAETHRVNIMRRLNCHSVTELVRYAIRNHIIEA